MRYVTLILMTAILFILIFTSLSSPLKIYMEHSMKIETVNRNELSGISRFTKQHSDLKKKVDSLTKSKFAEPTEWGEAVTGVIHKMTTEEKVVALTFDACGGEWGSGYDEALIDYLISEDIHATLFINSRWIDTNLEQFLYLASLDQFQIENHGTEHRPLSVNGGIAWGIKGTASVEEVISEVMTNYEKILSLTGHAPRYFRSGTAYYDEVSVAIVEEMGMKVINYDILGDAGATFSASQVRDSLLRSQPGSIALLHMNQPSKGTAEGVKMAVPLLKEQGFRFVTLNEGFQ
ncbi:polysaccharide deacetylase family protein [Anaerobacillus sp. CMMVII]|uniref:polysaccharide deacetylase family protein n=1 Tax=Anaerobacillus sp. CMMVII TaxID=2755588 RepID=UPI0021B7783C|nr:polysaccharide deacetylase family protein [Anaerobacillus sp. CMMVII]MCT8137222.1 polysaccharide deacetylase family protein [Anaerobacillus sp. CMMVII]